MLDRSFNVSWEDPGELGEQARVMSGLDFLVAIRDEELPPAPIQRLLDFTLTEVEEGRVVFTAEPGEQHYNPIGVVHGGLAATLLDTGPIAAEGRVVNRGRQGATAEGYLRDSAGKLLAHGTSTCLIIGG